MLKVAELVDEDPDVVIREDSHMLVLSDRDKVNRPPGDVISNFQVHVVRERLRILLLPNCFQHIRLISFNYQIYCCLP